MSYISLLYRSFFDANAYRHMHTNYRGSGFGYLFFLIALITAIYVSCALYSAHRIMFTSTVSGEQSLAERYAEQLTEQMPEVTILDGTLSTTAPQPYLFELTIEGETIDIAMIDTDGEPKILLEDNAPAILFTSEAMHIKDDRKIESLYFTELELENGQQLYMNADIAKGYATQAIGWVEENVFSNAIILFMLFWAFFVIIWLIWASTVGLAWALIVKLCAYFMKHSLPYEDALRLTFLIISPAYVIQTLMANTVRAEGFKAMPGDGISLLLYLLILLGTTVFAIRSIKSI